MLTRFHTSSQDAGPTTLYVCASGFAVSQGSQRLPAGTQVVIQESNQTGTLPAGFANFHGVTVETMMWLDNSSVIRNQQHYDDVAMRKYYVDMFRLQAPSVTQRPTAPAKHDARLSSPHQCLWSWS